MTTTLSSKKHYALPTLIIFLIILGGGLYYVSPLWSEVDGLKTEVFSLQQQKDTFSKQYQDLQDLQKSLNASSEVSQQTTLASIPERFEQDKLLQDLTDLAQKANVTLNGVNFSLAGNTQDKIKRATVNVNVTSSDTALIDFLRAVEGNTRKLVVKSITVQTGKTDTGATRVNFNLNMETYYQDRI